VTLILFILVLIQATCAPHAWGTIKLETKDEKDDDVQITACIPTFYLIADDTGDL
jgi:hypothetical protein